MELIDKILTEWSYRVHDGMPNPKNPTHLIELRDTMRELAILGREYKASTADTARETAILNREFEKIPSTAQKIIDKLDELNRKALNELESKFRKISDIIAEGIDTGIKRTSEGIARSIVLGEKLSDTFKKIAQDAIIRILSGLIEMGIRILANIAIVKIEEMLGRKKVSNQNKLNSGLKQEIALRAILAMFGGGGGGGSGIPFFNKGGSVRKDQPVIVGDSASGKGGELFVPNSSGQIIPNSRLGSMGGGVNVNFNINTVDATGFEELLVNSRGTISQIINQALNEKGQGNLI